MKRMVWNGFEIFIYMANRVYFEIKFECSNFFRLLKMKHQKDDKMMMMIDNDDGDGHHVNR